MTLYQCKACGTMHSFGDCPAERPESVMATAAWKQNPAPDAAPSREPTGCHVIVPPSHQGRPQGSNADEWALFLSEHKGAAEYVAVQIAEAIEAALERAEADVAAMRGALEVVAFESIGDTEYCRECDLLDEMHAPHCIVGQAISDHPGGNLLDVVNAARKVRKETCPDPWCACHPGLSDLDEALAALDGGTG